jgi:hypothetical protein
MNLLHLAALGAALWVTGAFAETTNESAKPPSKFAAPLQPEILQIHPGDPGGCSHIRSNSLGGCKLFHSDGTPTGGELEIPKDKWRMLQEPVK